MRLPTPLLALSTLALLATAQSAYDSAPAPPPTYEPAPAPPPAPANITTVTIEPCANSSSVVDAATPPPYATGALTNPIRVVPSGAYTGSPPPAETGTWVMPTGPSATVEPKPEESVKPYDGAASREGVWGGLVMVVLAGMGVLI